MHHGAHMDREPAQPMTATQLREAVWRLRWHHTMELGHGVVTPGGDATQEKLGMLDLPASLEGLTVLDVGFRDVRVVASRPTALSVVRTARRLGRAVRAGDPAPVATASADRLVVHARP
jgi:hypothetical protein